MKHTLFSLSFLFCLVLFSGVFAEAQTSDQALISIYQVSPGKHLEFIKWQAKQEAINKEAGIPATQWYAHQNGASWDYLAIAPVLTPDQEKKVDELGKQKGLPIGFKAGLEFRSFVSDHSDTFASGPFSISDMLKLAE